MAALSARLSVSTVLSEGSLDGAGGVPLLRQHVHVKDGGEVPLRDRAAPKWRKRHPFFQNCSNLVTSLFCGRQVGIATVSCLRHWLCKFTGKPLGTHPEGTVMCTGLASKDFITDCSGEQSATASGPTMGHRPGRWWCTHPAGC